MHMKKETTTITQSYNQNRNKHMSIQEESVIPRDIFLKPHFQLLFTDIPVESTRDL